MTVLLAPEDLVQRMGKHWMLYRDRYDDEKNYIEGKNALFSEWNERVRVEANLKGHLKEGAKNPFAEWQTSESFTNEFTSAIFNKALAFHVNSSDQDAINWLNRYWTGCVALCQAELNKSQLPPQQLPEEHEIQLGDEANELKRRRGRG